MHAEVHEESLDRFTAARSGLSVADPIDARYRRGPLASAQARKDLPALKDDALVRSAEAFTGGPVADDAAWYYPSTVRTGITP